MTHWIGWNWIDRMPKGLIQVPDDAWLEEMKKRGVRK